MPPCTAPFSGRLDNAKQASRLRQEFEGQARAIQGKYEAQLAALQQAAEAHYAAGGRGEEGRGGAGGAVCRLHWLLCSRASQGAGQGADQHMQLLQVWRTQHRLRVGAGSG